MRPFRSTPKLAVVSLRAHRDGRPVALDSYLPPAVATTRQVHDRYLDLTKVERDFRTLKTGLLEIRPVFVRKKGRPRGHAVVSLLALERRRAPLSLAVADAAERRKGVRLVCLGDRELEL